jgi:energy-coupling factor transporter ATP-binding protein EcfA2
MYSLPQNPFTRPAFWGRRNEINVISGYLRSIPPQCCALIGETSFGKTTLLRHLARVQSKAFGDEFAGEDTFIFVYLDCISYVDIDQIEDQASLHFWRDLYKAIAMQVSHATQPQPPLSSSRVASDQSLIDRAFELKSLVEALIQEQTRPVIFLFDNFEGIARLPLRDSMWLRSLAQYPCAYVVASRHLLYLLYQYHDESWASPSPLWNLFAEPLYLGLMDEEDVDVFLQQAGERAKIGGSLWSREDINFIKTIAGRHPELLRIACARMFEQRLQAELPFRVSEKDFSEIVYRNMLPICQLLWQSLADPELWNMPSAVPNQGKRLRETQPLSLYQQALIELAHGRAAPDETFLVLAQRGFVEQTAEGWRIFSGAMLQFVLAQEATARATLASALFEGGSEAALDDTQPLTHLEEKVYHYLQAHLGKVCDREEIKSAVWEQESERPKNSALQKIIERIRKKIEPQPDNPRYLIAVRGQGYMLRERPPELGPV